MKMCVKMIIISWAGWLVGTMNCTDSFVRAATRDYAVEVSLTVQESPPRFDFIWPHDPDADQYWVFRKLDTDTVWGDPVAILPGSTTSYFDTEIEPGRLYEYSFRKTITIISAEVSVPTGTAVTFTIYDDWGDGICCQHGLGAYEVAGDGVVFASGGEFQDSESTSFVTGAGGELVVSLILDAYPPETHWTVTNDAGGEILGQGGPYESARFGHICAAIRDPAVEDRGGVLLLIDGSLVDALALEIDRLERDLIGDGYRVYRQSVTAGQTVPQVKSLIVNTCSDEPEIGTLLILGHIPVPYSGDLAGVHSNHWGAWPADLYYGDLDGLWTDVTVDNTTAAWPENHNVPGDGKFDQTFLPSEVELQVGRVDLSRMPAFDLDETELLRQYLNKNHLFRHGEITAVPRGLIDDNVDESHGLAFAAVGWRNFTALFGQQTVFELDYFGTMTQDSYLFSYGVGGGSNTSCAGVGTTFDFAGQDVQTVFTALYGSYFGDWDKPDNLLRAPLASGGWPLVCFWAGRPTWHLHHMALGYPIGFSTRLTQNNNTEYTVSDGQRQIYIALMGDPTLRLHMVPPVSNLLAETEGAGIRLRWDPPSGAVDGYHVYRAATLHDRFERINPDLFSEPSFYDPAPLPSINYYMVRALKLETSGSGSYYNLSTGIIISFDPSQTPTPTPTPEYPLGVRIELAQNPVHPEDTFWVKGYLDNPEIPLSQVPVFFVLDIYQHYYFWPSWRRLNPPETLDIDYRRVDVPAGTTTLDVIPAFMWPDTGEDRLYGLYLYGAMLNAGMTECIGEMASEAWGYGP